MVGFTQDKLACLFYGKGVSTSINYVTISNSFPKEKIDSNVTYNIYLSYTGKNGEKLYLGFTRNNINTINTQQGKYQHGFYISIQDTKDTEAILYLCDGLTENKLESSLVPNMTFGFLEKDLYGKKVMFIMF